MSNFITSIIETLGYFGITLLMYVEMVIPVIPSEIIMPFAGFTASSGSLSLVGVVVAGSTGSILGALTLYGLARLIKNESIYEFVRRHGAWTGLTPENVKRAEKVFAKHDKAAVLFGRLIPGVRSVVSLPAGIEKMRVSTFAIFSLIGVTMWTALLAYLGFALGNNYEQVSHFIGSISNIVIAGIILAVVITIIWKRRKSR